MLYVTARGTEDYVEAEKIYLRAIALDPGFALAYARASMLNSQFPADDRAHKAKARAQAEEALRLSPALGEAHMALGLCLYWGEKKYDAALKEFEVAAATSPRVTWIPVATLAMTGSGLTPAPAPRVPPRRGVRPRAAEPSRRACAPARDRG